MRDQVTILAAHDLPEGIDDLVGLSLTEDFGALRKLVTEWEAGTNRFDDPGEVLVVAKVGDVLVGVCGLNRDPYVADPSLGRVRHLYVHPEYRRLGVGRLLVDRVVENARAGFRRLRLRTHSGDADAFYRAVGFIRTAGESDCTHEIRLTR